MTLRAMVAENEVDWYEDGAPLTRKLCEDMRQPDDVSQQLNYDCSICDEAKYEVSIYFQDCLNATGLKAHCDYLFLPCKSA